MGFSRYGKQTKIRMINQPCYILHFEFVLPVPMYCKLDSSVSPTAVKIQLEFLQSIGPKFSVKLTDSLSQIVSPESSWENNHCCVKFFAPYPQCPRTDLNKRLSHHESLYPIGLKSERIEILHGGFHYIDFSKTDFY